MRQGGGIYLNSTANIGKCTFTGNMCEGSNGTHIVNKDSCGADLNIQDGHVNIDAVEDTGIVYVNGWCFCSPSRDPSLEC